MIFFQSIKFKNFLSTGNHFSEIQFDKSPNTLIVGVNGAGKSTMLDALCFVLFGKAFRNINKPQLVNSINQKDCLVEILFRIGTNQYRIVRGIKPNVFEIYLNGTLVNQDAASRDYQEYLEKFVLKLNYKSFTQIVILGSASFVPFMQLSAADRRSIIEDLLDIQIFSVMNSILKDKLAINKEAIQTNKHTTELDKQKYDLLLQKINELKENNNTKKEEYAKKIQLNRTEIQKLHAAVSNTNVQIESLQELVQNKSEIESKLKKITKLESQIEANLSKYKKDISFFQQNDNCPTCRQEIALGFKETEIANTTTKVGECEHGLTQLEKKIIEEQSKLNAISETQKEIQKLQIDVAKTNTSITNLNDNITYLQTQIDGLSTTTDSLEKEQTQIEELEVHLLQMQTKLRELIEEKSYYEVASTLLKDTGIKTKIIKQYLPVINKLVNKYLSSFDFFVNFNLDESFKETIKSRHRDEFSYASFSEGEKQRIDMALMLTWRAVAKLKNSSNTNLLILDEVFDSSLDSNGTEYLMNVLQMLEDVNLFVISHKGDILQDKFRSVIKFDKVNNFSRIIQ